MNKLWLFELLIISMSEINHRLSCSNYIHFWQRIFIGVTFVATNTLSLPSTVFVATYVASNQLKNKMVNGTQFFFFGVDIGRQTINLLLSILFVYFPCRILAMSTKCPGPGPRKAIPHHIDSITKELKYVDPAHRNCVPGFKAASFTPKKKKDKYHGRTHNCIASMRMTSGDMYAVRIILHLSMWMFSRIMKQVSMWYLNYTYISVGLPWIL